MKEDEMTALVLLLFLPLCSLADQQSSISLGSTLSASDNASWASASGTFAFGFLPQTNDSNSYILAICYHKLTSITIVWSPRSGGSLADFEVGKQATVTLSSAGDLVLSDGTTTIWSTKTGSINVTGASMTDSGNFVLLNRVGEFIWESFSFPTHTLLPNQQLGVSGALANGNFHLEFLNNKLVLNYTLAVPANESYNEVYWSSAVINFQPSLSLDTSGRLAVHDDLGNLSAIGYTYDYSSTSNISRRFSLDSDGNARIYSLDLSSNSWAVVWQAVVEECSLFERCGLNAICVYLPEPTCICAPGFRMQNGSCIAEISIGCASNVSREKTKLIPLYHTDFRYNDLQFLYTSMDSCKSLCMDNCKCLAAVYSNSLAGNQRCYLKFKLANGQQLTSTPFVSFLKVIATATLDERYQLPQNITSYVTISPSVVINSTREVSIEVRKKTSILLGPLSAALAVAVVEFCCLMLAACVIWKSRSQKMLETGWISSMPRRFSYEQLKIATQNFKEMIGEGGFGQVYKGIFPDNTVTAIKKLELANHGEQQFKSEVTTMGKIHHINLVRLLGYCSEGPHRLLVHQYITNGSLDKFLFSKNWDQTCNWNIRFGIAVGIARGITYLHEQCQECILHLDIKPQNVLLDENFQPKICDFGMAKLISREMVASMSAIRGTRGYLAPEWMSHHPITAKADVYSYGMLLLEILSGRPNCLTTSSIMKTDQWYFPDWAAEKLEDGDLEAMADPRLGKEIDWDQFVNALKVSLWCIRLDPASRFEMSKVVQMLEGSLEIHSPLQTPDTNNVN